MAIKSSKPPSSSSKNKPPASSSKRPAPSSQRPTSSTSDRNLSSRISPPPAARPNKSQQPQTAAISSNQTDEMASRLASVRSSWERVAGTVALASLVSALANVTSRIDGVGRDLALVRSRGYRYGRDWETQLDTMRQRWPQQHGQAQQLLQKERRVLETAARDVETMLQRANRDAGLLSTVESRVWDLERSVSQAETRVRQTFGGVAGQADALGLLINQAKFVLDSLDGACFELTPGENPIAACEATWTSDPQAPEGLLFLTDARVIFEQRQEVAKKKVLFITTQKELVQEKLWEAPIGAVDDVEIEDQKALLQRKEMITLRFHERTRELPSDVTLQLKGTDNESWRTLLRRAKAGDIDGDRLGAPAPEEQLAAQIEAESTTPAKELPTTCPKCNAPLPQIFKGMRQVTCDYCDATINL